MAKKSKRSACPHCGNRDPKQMEDNGASESSFDYTLLCMARVKPGSEAQANFEPKAVLGPDGTVACAMQWCPNA